MKLIKNYWLNRKQITKFNNVKSDSKNIMFGVPQGSVLGTLIFLLYINDIVNSAFEGETVIFASVLNHSTLEFRDFSKRVPAVEIILDQRIFER